MQEKRFALFRAFELIQIFCALTQVATGKIQQAARPCRDLLRHSWFTWHHFSLTIEVYDLRRAAVGRREVVGKGGSLPSGIGADDSSQLQVGLQRCHTLQLLQEGQGGEW